jgi:hypothetical protein
MQTLRNHTQQRVLPSSWGYLWGRVYIVLVLIVVKPILQGLLLLLGLLLRLLGLSFGLKLLLLMMLLLLLWGMPLLLLAEGRCRWRHGWWRWLRMVAAFRTTATSCVAPTPVPATG